MVLESRVSDPENDLHAFYGAMHLESDGFIGFMNLAGDSFIGVIL